MKQINAHCSEVKLTPPSPDLPLKFALGILSQNVEDLKIKKWSRKALFCLSFKQQPLLWQKNLSLFMEGFISTLSPSIWSVEISSISTSYLRAKTVFKCSTALLDSMISFFSKDQWLRLSVHSPAIDSTIRALKTKTLWILSP